MVKDYKKNIHAFNFPEYLVDWNYSKKSLSSNLKQKIFDGYRVYNTYLKFNVIKSLYYLFLLSLNSIKKEVLMYYMSKYTLLH